MDVEQHRPGGVGDVGRMDPSACEAPQEEAVDGAEGDLAVLEAALQEGGDEVAAPHAQPTAGGQAEEDAQVSMRRTDWKVWL